MEQKENIKIGLLGIIAAALIINTYGVFQNKNNTSSMSPMTSSNTSAPMTPATQPEIKPIEPTTQPVPTGPTTTIQFAEETHNFGNIKQDTENHHIFKFKNTGSEPLIISNAKGSCGCTVPKYPKDPIAPGATGEIEVTYSPGKQKGNQTKTVTITANTNPVNTMVKIMANVEEI